MHKRFLNSEMPMPAALRNLRFAAVLALLQPCLAATCMAQNAALSWRQDPTSGCGFVAPLSLGTGPIYWTGECPDGKAAGAGMLRRRDSGRAGAAFYGDMEAGVPKQGIVDSAGGYRVGPFVAGDIGGRSLAIQVRRDAIAAAVRGARAVSAHYAASKNGVSAEYYEDIAKTLEAQAK